jgi:anti-anti-sigma factor
MSDPGRPSHAPLSRYWTLQIARESRDGVRMVIVSGRVAAASAPLLANALTEELGSGALSVLLDFARVDYVSSAALGVLADAVRLAAERQVPLVLGGISEPVRLAIDLAGMRDDFEIR